MRTIVVCLKVYCSANADVTLLIVQFYICVLEQCVSWYRGLFLETPIAQLVGFQGSPRPTPTPPKMPHLWEYTMYLHHFARVKGKSRNGFLDCFRQRDTERRLDNCLRRTWEEQTFHTNSLYVVNNNRSTHSFNSPVTTLNKPVTLQVSLSPKTTVVFQASGTFNNDSHKSDVVQRRNVTYIRRPCG